MSLSFSVSESSRAELLARLQQQWEEKLAASSEVREARSSLHLHKRKIQQLQDQLSSARGWEEELEMKACSLKERLKPPLLKLKDSLERSSAVQEGLVRECLESHGWREVVLLVAARVERAAHLERGQLVRLAKTVIMLRNYLHGEEVAEAGEVEVQDLARRLLRELARADIYWMEMEAWEAEFMRQLVTEVAGLPRFVAMILDQLLEEVARSKGRDVVTRGLQARCDETHCDEEL